MKRAMRKTKLFFLLAAVGCSGGADAGPTWQGTYVGQVTTTARCAFPSTQSDVTLMLGQNETTLSWLTDCGVLATAAVVGGHGTIAAAEGYSCPPKKNANSSGESTLSVTGGTLTLEGDSLQVDLSGELLFLNSGVSCPATVQGTFQRE